MLLWQFDLFTSNVVRLFRIFAGFVSLGLAVLFGLQVYDVVDLMLSSGPNVSQLDMYGIRLTGWQIYPGIAVLVVISLGTLFGAAYAFGFRKTDDNP